MTTPVGVYANAEKILLAHAPSLKRAQRGDVQAAIAAKEAKDAAAVAAKTAKGAHAAAVATHKINSKARSALSSAGASPIRTE